MKSSVLFIVLIVGSSIVTHASLIEDSCKTAVASSDTVGYDFCVQSINSDPRSKSADAKGLAVIATNLCITNTTSTHAKFVGLLKGATDKRLRSCLAQCEEVYFLTITVLGQTPDSIQSGRYSDATTYLSAALTDARTCEEGFTEGGISPMLQKENNDAMELYTIALSFTSSLIK